VTAPPPLHSLLPHAGIARMAERIVEERPDGLVVEGRIPAGHALVRDGRAPTFAALELAAQAAAVLEGLERARSGGDPFPRIGYVVAVREAVFHRREIPAGQAFRAEVRLEGGAATLRQHRARVTLDAEPLLDALISTYLPPD
jgi:predicted hotdog family 3-hydroxylacyl-ACP dehydratase